MPLRTRYSVRLSTVFLVRQKTSVARGRLVREQVQQKLLLVPRLHGQVVLLHHRRRERARRRNDLLGVTRERAGQRLDLRGKRRRDEHRLAILRARAQDAPDVVAEADVEHPVHFVKDGDLDVVVVQVAALLHVHEPAGRGDDDLRPAGQSLGLRGNILPAVDRQRGQPRVLAKLVQVGRHLDRQLARRHQDDRAHGLALAKPREQRQAERGGLARARLGLAEHVLALQQQRNDLGLDSRGMDEPRLGHAAERVGAEPEVGELHRLIEHVAGRRWAGELVFAHGRRPIRRWCVGRLLHSRRRVGRAVVNAAGWRRISMVLPRVGLGHMRLGRGRTRGRGLRRGRSSRRPRRRRVEVLRLPLARRLGLRRTSLGGLLRSGTGPTRSLLVLVLFPRRGVPATVIRRALVLLRRVRLRRPRLYWLMLPWLMRCRTWRLRVALVLLGRRTRFLRMLALAVLPLGAGDIAGLGVGLRVGPGAGCCSARAAGRCGCPAGGCCPECCGGRCCCGYPCCGAGGRWPC